MKQRTAKGDEIAKYVRESRLPDGGRGFIVLGAFVSPIDGHAYENRCHSGCRAPRVGLTANRLGRLWKFKVWEVDEWVRAGGADENSDAPPDRGRKRRPK